MEDQIFRSLTEKYFEISSNNSIYDYKYKVNNFPLTSVSLMISPLLRQSFLLSSSTVFMFSIQTASTGPSNTYQRFLGSVAPDPIRIKVERIPSVLRGERNDNF